jgi:Right handed beta helix region
MLYSNIVRRLTKVLSVGAVVASLGASASFADIRDTIQAAASGTTVTVTGTYTVTAKITVPSGVTIKGPAVFKFTTGAAADGFYIPAANHNVTMTSIEVRGANHGIMIYGYSNSIQSCIAQYNQNSGIEVIGSAAKNNVINNCQGKYNCDNAGGGGNADGFACKFSAGSGNKFTNCDAHGNSDDGYDFAGTSSSVTVSGCKSYTNGYYNGYTGNGCGFKMGLSGDNGAHVFTSCNAYSNTAGNTGSGFDTNNNAATIKLTSCKSYSNKQADRLQHVTLVSCSMQY